MQLKAPTYRLRFLFDYGCDGCLWGGNDAAYEKFGVGVLDGTVYDLQGNIIQEPRIKLPDALQSKVFDLCALYDSSLNWNSPAEPEPSWTREKSADFDLQSKELYREICAFLGADYELTYEHGSNGD